MTRKVVFKSPSRDDGYLSVRGHRQYVRGFEISLRAGRLNGLEDLIALEAIGLKGGTVKARLELSASQAEELLTTLREVLDERKDSEADVGEA